MKKDKIVAIGLGMSLIVGFGFIYKVRIDEKRSNEEIINSVTSVEVSSIEKTEMFDYIKYIGKVKGSEEKNVTKILPSKITEILVKNGDFVNKGDALVKLDSSSVNEIIKKSEENYNNALKSKDNTLENIKKIKLEKDELTKKIDEDNKNLESKKSQLEILTNELEKINKEFSSGLIKEEDFKQKKGELQKEIGDITLDISELTKDITTSSLKLKGIEKSLETLEKSKVLDGNIEVAESMYTNILKLKDSFKITSPVSGNVYNLNVKVGDKETNPMEPLMEIVNTNKVHIPIGVDEEELKYFKIGEKVSCEILNGKEKIKKEGEIFSVDDKKDRITEQYTVVIEVYNSDSTIERGDFAKVFVSTGNRKKANAISKDSIIREEDKTYVYIVEDGIAKKKEIKIKNENDDFIEVSNGIAEGDKVITKGKEYLKNGDKVNIVGGEK